MRPKLILCALLTLFSAPALSSDEDGSDTMSLTPSQSPSRTPALSLAPAPERSVCVSWASDRVAERTAARAAGRNPEIVLFEKRRMHDILDDDAADVDDGSTRGGSSGARLRGSGALRPAVVVCAGAAAALFLLASNYLSAIRAKRGAPRSSLALVLRFAAVVASAVGVFEIMFVAAPAGSSSMALQFRQSFADTIAPLYPDSYCMEDRLSDVFMYHWFILSLGALIDLRKEGYRVRVYLPWLNPENSPFPLKSFHNETLALLGPEFDIRLRHPDGSKGEVGCSECEGGARRRPESRARLAPTSAPPPPLFSPCRRLRRVGERFFHYFHPSPPLFPIRRHSVWLVDSPLRSAHPDSDGTRVFPGLSSVPGGAARANHAHAALQFILHHAQGSGRGRQARRARGDRAPSKYRK